MTKLIVAFRNFANAPNKGDNYSPTSSHSSYGFIKWSGRRNMWMDTHLEVSCAGDVEGQKILYYSYWTPGESPAVGASSTVFLHVCSQLGRPMSSAGCPASRSCFQGR
jgi:hypothetical protein